MTTNERRSYAAMHVRATKRLESPFVKPVQQAIQSQIDKVIKVLEAEGVHAAKIANEKMIINEELYKPISDLYKVMGLYQARKTTREINKSARTFEQKAGFGNDQGLLSRIIAALKQFIFSRVIIPITQTTRDLILQTIIKGEEEGWGIKKMVDELGQTDITKSRAYLIVRTEAQKAMRYGQEISANTSRWATEKEWISAHDPRTRTSHRIVDGMKVDEGVRFAVPIIKKNIQIGVDMMLGPGDPQATAGNVCNCRCTMVTKAKRDERGRLVLKSQSQSFQVV